MCTALHPTAILYLDVDSEDNIGEGEEESIVEFDVKKAPLINIKLMVGSSIALDYGPLYVITPPTQILFGAAYYLRFTWPRPPDTDSLSSTDDEDLPRVGGPLWLSATSDYDPDRGELKAVRGLLGRDVLLSGLICIERLALDPEFTGQDAANTEEISETYLVLWGLGRKAPMSAHQDRVRHGELYSESVWCYIVTWDDVLDPSLAPLAHDILQLDLASTLTRIQGALLLSGNDLKENCTVARSRRGPASGIKAQILCLDFFGQETLQLRVENSYTNQ